MELPAAIHLACIWEVVAAKPGNVHRSADFHDTGLVDFLASAAMVGQAAGRWLQRDLRGHDEVLFADWVLDGVRATRQVTTANTNLGILLLICPLLEAAARCDQPLDATEWQATAADLVHRASVRQTRLLYQAIAEAGAGGLGQVSEADVSAAMSLQDTDTVRHVMGLAAERDTIAAEYVSGFAITFGETVPGLRQFVEARYPLQWAILAVFLQLLARRPDTLIQRKSGREAAQRVSDRAGELVDEYFPNRRPQPWGSLAQGQAEMEAALGDFDFSLRVDGNRWNPGTTADLLAAGLFVALASQQIQPPLPW